MGAKHPPQATKEARIEVVPRAEFGCGGIRKVESELQLPSNCFRVLGAVAATPYFLELTADLHADGDSKYSFSNNRSGLARSSLPTLPERQSATHCSTGGTLPWQRDQQSADSSFFSRSQPNTGSAARSKRFGIPRQKYAGLSFVLRLMKGHYHAAPQESPTVTLAR